MTSTPDLGVDLDRLLELAQEAAAAEGHWYSRGFLEAFIDDDDDRLFPATDARFIEAVTPSTVSELIRRLRAAEAGGLDVDALERAYLRVIDRTPWVEVVFSANGVLETQRRMLLERIAAEYAALRESTDE